MVVGRVWSFRDVTDRTQVEETLKESESRYRTIFESTGTAMVIIEEDTTVGFANKEFFRLTSTLRTISTAESPGQNLYIKMTLTA